MGPGFESQRDHKTIQSDMRLRIAFYVSIIERRRLSRSFKGSTGQVTAYRANQKFVIANEVKQSHLIKQLWFNEIASAVPLS